jgi:hypothetical protein
MEKLLSRGPYSHYFLEDILHTHLDFIHYPRVFDGPDIGQELLKVTAQKEGQAL